MKGSFFIIHLNKIIISVTLNKQLIILFEITYNFLNTFIIYIFNKIIFLPADLIL